MALADEAEEAGEESQCFKACSGHIDLSVRASKSWTQNEAGPVRVHGENGESFLRSMKVALHMWPVLITLSKLQSLSTARSFSSDSG